MSFTSAKSAAESAAALRCRSLSPESLQGSSARSSPTSEEEALAKQQQHLESRWEQQLAVLASRQPGPSSRLMHRRPPRHAALDTISVCSNSSCSSSDVPHKQRRLSAQAQDPAEPASCPFEEIASMRFNLDIALMENKHLKAENAHLKEALAEREKEAADVEAARGEARREAAGLRARVLELESVHRGLENRLRASKAQLEAAQKRAEQYRASGAEAVVSDPRPRGEPPPRGGPMLRVRGQDAFEHEAEELDKERREAEERAELFEEELKSARELWRTAAQAAEESNAEAEREVARRKQAEAALARAKAELAAKDAELAKVPALRKSLFEKMASMTKAAVETKTLAERLRRAEAALSAAGLSSEA
eukprot:tig00020934_g16095.t1